MQMLHPHQMHGPLEQVYFVLVSLLLCCGGVIEKHVNYLLLRNVCFPRANIPVTISSLNSLKSVKFLYWCSFQKTPFCLSAICVNYLSDLRLCPLLKRSRNRSREIWSRTAFHFREFDFN